MTLALSIFEEVQTRSYTAAQLASLHMQSITLINDCVDALVDAGKLHRAGVLVTR